MNSTPINIFVIHKPLSLPVARDYVLQNLFLTTVALPSYLIHILPKANRVGDGIGDLLGHVLLLSNVIHHVMNLIHIPDESISYSLLKSFFVWYLVNH